MDTKIKVYILQESRHIACSIFYLPDDFYIESEEYSVLLDNLAKETDLFFIFPKILTKKISPKKFSVLYDAMGYAISETENESYAILNAFDYLDEVFKKHVYYLVIEHLSPFPTENLHRIFGLQLQKAVFNSYRNNYKDLEEIYTKEEKTYTWWEKLLGKDYDEDNNSGLYCRDNSDDDYFLLPVNIFRKLLEKYGEKYYYLSSFRDYGFNTFIASSTEGEDLMNSKLDEI